MRKFIGEFTIDEQMPGLNDIIRASKTHWATYAKMKTKYTDLACEAAFHIRAAKGKIMLHIEWHEPKDGRRDPDNIWVSKKFILDGLICAGVIPDDNKNCVYGVSDVTCYDMPSKQFRVDVEVYELGGH